MKLFGHDFGRTPMGLHQVLAFRRDCTCDPEFIHVAHDIACPTHGLAAHLKQLAARSGGRS